MNLLYRILASTNISKQITSLAKLSFLIRIRFLLNNNSKSRKIIIKTKSLSLFIGPRAIPFVIDKGSK